MVHLTVAIGRFVEALFWAIAQVAGWVALIVVAGAAALAGVFGVARLMIQRRR